MKMRFLPLGLLCTLSSTALAQDQITYFHEDARFSPGWLQAYDESTGTLSPMELLNAGTVVSSGCGQVFRAQLLDTISGPLVRFGITYPPLGTTQTLDVPAAGIYGKLRQMHMTQSCSAVMTLQYFPSELIVAEPTNSGNAKMYSLNSIMGGGAHLQIDAMHYDAGSDTIILAVHDWLIGGPKDLLSVQLDASGVPQLIAVEPMINDEAEIVVDGQGNVITWDGVELHHYDAATLVHTQSLVPLHDDYDQIFRRPNNLDGVMTVVHTGISMRGFNQNLTEIQFYQISNNPSKFVSSHPTKNRTYYEDSVQSDVFFAHPGQISPRIPLSFSPVGAVYGDPNPPSAFSCLDNCESGTSGCRCDIFCAQNPEGCCPDYLFTCGGGAP